MVIGRGPQPFFVLVNPSTTPPRRDRAKKITRDYEGTCVWIGAAHTMTSDQRLIPSTCMLNTTVGVLRLVLLLRLAGIFLTAPRISPM